MKSIIQIHLEYKEDIIRDMGMNEVIISSILTEQGSQLLYVYDFMKMWRFLVSLTETSEEEITETRCIKSVGIMPTDAPEITFEAEKEFDPFEDAFEDFDEFNENEEY